MTQVVRQVAGTAQTAATASEAKLRDRLGIPADAKRVLVFSESSHWDTNWLKTSDEYFDERLRPIFSAVLTALEQDPRRVYCIESVFFLKIFWERHPEEQARLRALLERRQLRVLTSSFTTPDTLLPHQEAILRDFHLGQQWLHSQGLSSVPRTAYFPDNFGHSPHLPSLMRAVGVDSVALTRIDGMYFIASDFRRKSSFPLKGSTAELLQKELRTLDFIWRDDDGAEVLCHWNAFTYFQGDMLAHAGIVRWNGLVAAIPWRTRRHIAGRIDGFVRQLEPLSRTPYMLCPIGMDFNDPIDRLPELLHRYNEERFGSTGTWALLAGMDDYFELVGHHSARLPVLSVDPNPYWMGFYASRPELKQRSTRLTRTLLLAEALSALKPAKPLLEGALREGWLNLVLMNHHDAITGTSPDRISHGEHRDWLDNAEAAASEALALAADDAPLVAPEKPEKMEPEEPPVSARGARWRGRALQIRTAHHRLTFSKERGGCLTSLVLDGEEQLRGLGLDLVAYADDGGLWRLGHEYRGGTFREVDRTSRRPARIELIETDDAIRVDIESDLRGKRFARTITCSKTDPFIGICVEGFAGRRLSVTCRFEMVDNEVTLEMDTVGGTIERPRERVHQPTFWPVPSLLTLQGASGGTHVGFETPTAVSFRPDHTLEWIVARNPMKERAFGLLPVLAHPIGGTVDELQTHRAAMFFGRGRGVCGEVRRCLENGWLSPAHQSLKERAVSLVRCDDPAVSFAALKRADAGGGVIVRLACEIGAPRTVRVWIPSQTVRTAFLCNAREETLGQLAIESGQVLVPLDARLTTVRLVVSPQDANRVAEACRS
jgi:Glycosyl hydrolases family 38 N-terminal domain/Alpha mannosidase middle domain